MSKSKKRCYCSPLLLLLLEGRWWARLLRLVPLPPPPLPKIIFLLVIWCDKEKKEKDKAKYKQCCWPRRHRLFRSSSLLRKAKAKVVEHQHVSRHQTPRIMRVEEEEMQPPARCPHQT